MNIRSRIAAAFAAIVCATGAFAQGTLVDVVEYYNATLDHYFISSLAGDIGALDSGTLKGWARTGQVFKAYDAPAAGTSPVCRFYIPPAQGDSHFYSASPAECAEVAAKFPSFSFESPSVMHVGLPDAATGACSPGWTPVFRLWNSRADSNHRYTTDAGVRADMLARGYVAEGYGPDGVAMCSPNGGGTFDLTFTSSALILMPGDVRDAYLIVTPRNGFAGTVAVTIDGLPPGVTAQILKASLTIGPRPVATRVRFTASTSASPTAADSPVTVRGQADDTTSSGTYIVGIAPAGDPLAVRLRAIDAVGERMQEFAAQGLNGGDLVNAVAGFMATHPDYAEAGASRKDGTAWGLLRDGVMHVVIANRDPAPVSATSMPIPPARKASGDPELPGVAKAYAMHAFSEYFEPQQAVTRIRSYLKNRGWHVWEGADGDASVRSLARVKGAGFFYFNGHGGQVQNKLPDPTGLDAWIYAAITSELADGRPDAAIDALLKKGPALVIASAWNGYTLESDGSHLPLTGKFYGITRHFVSNFMHFESDSVVFINACGSADNGFIKAFHDAGAGVYLGWVDAVTPEGAAFTSAPYMVDRLVGANAYPLKESPPQRPFPLDKVVADMARKGLKQDSKSGSALGVYPNAGSTAQPILAPSIQYVTVDEWEGLLTLTGDFGSPTPKVTVGGRELNLKQWSNSKIVAELPSSGAGSSGDVIVEVQGIRSNARQLTKWTIPLAYQWLDWERKKGLKIEGDGKVIFRADVGGYRLEPAEQPRYLVRGGVSNRESSLKVTASGTHSDGSCTYTASGSEEYYSPARLGALLSTVLQSYLSLDTEQRRASVGLALGGIDLATEYTRSGTDCKYGPHQMTPLVGFLDGSMEFPADQSEDPDTLPLPAIHFTVDKNFTFPAIVGKGGGVAYEGVRVSWPVVAAESPPRDTPDAGK
ncbi:MAG: hypothetical protein IPM22_06820 [Betaproteobacteria bacterium]|nr:hypothetical protein [Betaproteobacteria bacterium]